MAYSMMVEATYGMLTDDIAVVYHVAGGRLFLCIVLVVSGFIFMPVNSLYCSDYVVKRLEP